MTYRGASVAFVLVGLALLPRGMYMYDFDIDPWDEHCTPMACLCDMTAWWTKTECWGQNCGVCTCGDCRPAFGKTAHQRLAEECNIHGRPLVGGSIKEDCSFR